MAGRKGGLGRGISSLIPTHTEQRRGGRPETASDARKRPVDVFFDGAPAGGQAHSDVEAAEAAERGFEASRRGSSRRERADPTAAGGSDSANASKKSRRQKTAKTVPAPDAVEVSEADVRIEVVEQERNTAASAVLRAADEAAAAEGVSVDTVEQTPAETDLAAVPGLTLIEVSPHDVVPNPVQPRKEFDEEALDELVHSVREFGVLQPIVVRRREEGGYELIMGERRLRASKAAGLEAIPAIVRETADEDMLRDALLENLHRSNLNPLEEASAYQQLMQDFGITQEQLAQRIGRSRPQVSNTLRLLKLPTGVQSKVAAGVLSAGHARALLSLAETHDIDKVADKVIHEGLSVRETEQLGERTPRRQAKAKARAGGIQDQLHEVAERLEDQLDTRVRVSLSKKKGQIVIDFATVGDLNRIVGALGVKGFGEH
ncbi:ParB/RepB/Spo0J family partition protein [Pseudoclavibacter sp. CFCC 14310]|nr:ParB/RepB/Spo0J family partition protein [Pseudoclavibacter sp. CFCC 14310]